MPFPRFELVSKATNLGLSHLAKCVPIFVRAGLLMLFGWYGLELLLSATHPQAKIFLIATVGVFLFTGALIMLLTYVKYPWTCGSTAGAATTPLWPFLVINILMILLVAAIGYWEQDSGLLGFTQHWVQKIANLLRRGL
ncbi:MAG TPA: hypothetical protein VN345_20300 [Blastocatellia bacterium]|nr:hypothetical protein [Blastocatellia bacterium]